MGGQDARPPRSFPEIFEKDVNSITQAVPPTFYQKWKHETVKLLKDIIMSETGTSEALTEEVATSIKQKFNKDTRKSISTSNVHELWEFLKLEKASDVKNVTEDHVHLEAELSAFEEEAGASALDFLESAATEIDSTGEAGSSSSIVSARHNQSAYLKKYLSSFGLMGTARASTARDLHPHQVSTDTSEVKHLADGSVRGTGTSVPVGGYRGNLSASPRSVTANAGADG